MKSAVTDETQKFGNIHFMAHKDVTCYIIRGENGDLLIDCGFNFSWDMLRKWLENYNIKHIILTHAHPDHDWNCAKIKEAYGVKIILKKEDVDIKDDCTMQKMYPCFSKYIFRTRTVNFGMKFFKNPPFEADILIDDDCDVLKSLGYIAEVIKLPGHTKGSIGILSGDVLYCGDEVTALCGKPDISFHGADVEMVRKSLETIREINPEWLACGHGLPVRMDEAREIIEDYITHGYR